MDTKKTKHASVAIIVRFLLFVLVAALYSPVLRTGNAADDNADVKGTQSDTSVSSLLHQIISESKKDDLAESGDTQKKASVSSFINQFMSEPNEIIDESDLFKDTIWYAGTWDSTLYLNARYPRTVAVKIKLLDKDTRLPINNVGVALKGEYEKKLTIQDTQNQVDLSIFHDLRTIKSLRQRRKFGLDAISDTKGIVVFSLNWDKEYSWKIEEEEKTSDTQGARAIIHAGDIETVMISRITHSEYKNVEIPVDFKRIVNPKLVVLDLGETFPDLKNKRSRRIEFFEKIRSQDSIAYRDVTESTLENKTRCGPYLVYDLGEILLERTAPRRSQVSRSDRVPAKKKSVDTHQSRPPQPPKPPEKTVEVKDQTAQESKPEQKSIEQPKPDAPTAKDNVKIPGVNQANLKEKIIDFSDGVTMKLVLIPAGEFQMGSPSIEIGRDSDEGPVHKVRIDRPFYMSVYEVTQEQYEKVTGMNPSKYTGPKRPVHMVSWNDAQIFCQTLSSLVGGRFRLPTEAEWEYACRAGTTTAFYWGNGFDDHYVWSLDNSKGTLHEVGSRLPNAWGLYDMSGNLWEWCEDAYDEYHPVSDDLLNAKTTSATADRILRGGSWNIKLVFSRSANRSRNVPNARMDYNGFRVVLDVK